MYIVYKATHSPTGKIYVGQTGQLLQQRIGQHWGTPLSKQKPFQIFLHNTKMDEWVWEVLHTVATKEEANNCEMYYINTLKLYEHGLNTKGGLKDLAHREAASARMKAYRAENPEPWHKGRTGVYSEETLELMRQAKLKNPTRRVFSDEAKLASCLRATNAKRIIEIRSLLSFNSISEASKYFGIRRESVRDVVNGKRTHTKGLIFLEEGGKRHMEFVEHAREVLAFQATKKAKS
jgi:group I intron endonuclease